MAAILAREDWLKAARLALLRTGVGSVRVETIAKQLGVTKGSFYWHFSDRAELLETLLAEWEAEAELLTMAIAGGGESTLLQLSEQLSRNVVLSEAGEVPSDAAIFAWAATTPAIARRVATAEERRVALVVDLIGNRRRAEFIYMAYLGYILRRRHAPDASELFRIILDAITTRSISLSANEPAPANTAATGSPADQGGAANCR